MCVGRVQVVSDPDLVRFLARSVAFITYTLGLTSALGTLGIDTKPLVAGISVSGFVIGFTLKEVRPTQHRLSRQGAGGSRTTL